MKTLVIYYSFEGNTRFIAETIVDEIGADLLELKLKKEIKSTGPLKYLQGGSQAMRKEKPELYPLDRNPNDYDVLFIGTPVWAWTFTPALNSFLSSHKIEGKKIALFCCHGGGPGKTLENLKTALPGNEFLGESEYRDPLRKDKKTYEEKARKWVKELLNLLTLE